MSMGSGKWQGSATLPGVGVMGEKVRQEGCPGLVPEIQCQAIPVPAGLTKRDRGKGWEGENT